MRALCVAAAGGHLLELHRLLPRFEPAIESTVWVTFDNAQARSLLAGEEVHFVKYAATHDPLTTIRNLAPAWRLLRQGRFDVVVSTGSSIAVSFLPLARLFCNSVHYIESATRIDGPSLTGRILGPVPGIRRYTQHPSWANSSWRYEGSVFDGWKVEQGEVAAIERLVVSIGSARDYGFRRLVERVVELVPAGAEVLWQTGPTEISDLGIEAVDSLPFEELAAAQRAADVVVVHAGIGSTLTALEAGRLPVVVPRRAAYNEHIDDHQVQNATMLADRGLAVAREVEDLVADDLRFAAAHRVVVAADAPPFHLAP